MPDIINDRTIYTLSEITGAIKYALTVEFPGSFWVIAEIAKLNYYPYSGHCYPDLLEKQENTIKAQMRGTIWADNYFAISRKFKDVTKESLDGGMKVLLLATITFHEVYGLALNILDIEPAFTLGEMAREKRDTIEKLKKEDLFEKNKQLRMPLLPKHIAVISVETSKGYSDLLTTLDNNPWGYAFIHVLFPAILQGDKAVESIIKQLSIIRRKASFFDAVAIIRGGGDDVGLSCYDHYNLAREVALFPIPVITGIGHSTNETVVEMIAHTNKITPTDVGHFLIQRFHDFSVQINEIQDKIVVFTQNMLDTENHKLQENIRLFRSLTLHMLDTHRLGFVHVLRGLHTTIHDFLLSAGEKILDANGTLKYAVLAYISGKHHALNSSETKIQLLNPLNILKRGYSITQYKGKPLVDAGVLKPGEVITTHLFSGIVNSKVTSTQTDHGKEDHLH
jgi:exodeoxyribonuclease VII large subunit